MRYIVVGAKSLRRDLVFLYFARQMGNRCGYILDHVQLNMEKHYIRQIRELENQYLVPPVFFRKS